MVLQIMKEKIKMFGFILGILLFIAAIAAGIYFIADDEKGTGIGVLLGGIVLSIVFVVLGCFTKVDTGYTGILVTFGKVEDCTLSDGFHAKAPWQKVVKMDNHIQKASVDLACFSSDTQEVSCKYTLNYQINKDTAQEIYRNVGKDYYDIVITPNVSKSVKAIMTKYSAETLIANRDTLATEIENLLAVSLQKYNIELVSTAIEDLDFTDEFTNAVEAKQVALQNKLKATIEQEQKTIEAQQEAERTKIKAETDAEVAKIQAQADLEVQKINADAAEYTGQKEAAKNKAISESLTPDLLKYYQTMQWNGQYPNYYVGSDNVSTIVGNVQ